MKKSSLFDIIYGSFGLNGKSIQLVNKRKIDTLEKVEDIYSTKDGMQILNHYARANPGDIISKLILNEVVKYEKRYGDGTSLLTLLLVFLSKERNSTIFKKESICMDIDTILADIEKQRIPEASSEEESGSHIERWVKTVCKQDKICDKIIKFLKENPKTNICSISNIDKPEDEREIIFEPKKGYFVSCYAERRFLSAHYARFTDVVFHLMDDELSYDKYIELENEAIRARTNYLIVCRNYSKETEELINSSGSTKIMVIKYATSEKSEQEIKEDLRFMFKLKDLKDGSGSIGDIKRVFVNEDGIYFMEPKKEYDELLEYAKEIKANFIGNELARSAMLYRISNILSNNSFDILINTNTYTRQNVIRDMADDVFRSLQHYDKGLIKGGMSYVNTKHHTGGKIIQILRVIKERLIEGINHNNSCSRTPAANSFVPIDLIENTKAIFKIVKEFCLELMDTYEEPLISDSNIY